MLHYMDWLNGWLVGCVMVEHKAQCGEGALWAGIHNMVVGIW